MDCSGGVTEATVYQTSTVCTLSKPRSAVGLPFRHTRISISPCCSSDEPQLAPRGAAGPVGEIRISGAQVSRGYLHDEVLSKEKFVLDERGERWYCTGDLGRWEHTGADEEELVVCGRMDTQVADPVYRFQSALVSYWGLRCDR